MPLIQVTSGGQRSLLKKKLQVCESQQSCLFVGDQILIFHHNLQINYLKILQCDFLDFVSYFVSHSWGIPMMKITGLSHLFKWENLHNWWLTKYFFAPLYIPLLVAKLLVMSFFSSCGFLFYHLHYYGGCLYVKGTKQILLAVCVVEFSGLHIQFVLFVNNSFRRSVNVFTDFLFFFSFFLFWQPQLPKWFCKNYRIIFVQFYSLLFEQKPTQLCLTSE